MQTMHSGKDRAVEGDVWEIPKKSPASALYFAVDVTFITGGKIIVGCGLVDI
jgi:hypothetical protein